MKSWYRNLKNRSYNLQPGDSGFVGWNNEFNLSKFGPFGKLEGVDAEIDEHGCAHIIWHTLKLRGKNPKRYDLTVWFNQSPDEDEITQIEDDPGNWLGGMAGATEWREWIDYDEGYLEGEATS